MSEPSTRHRTPARLRQAVRGDFHFKDEKDYRQKDYQKPGVVHRKGLQGVERQYEGNPADDSGQDRPRAGQLEIKPCQSYHQKDIGKIRVAYDAQDAVLQARAK